MNLCISLKLNHFHKFPNFPDTTYTSTWGIKFRKFQLKGAPEKIKFFMAPSFKIWGLLGEEMWNVDGGEWGRWRWRQGENELNMKWLSGLTRNLRLSLSLCHWLSSGCKFLGLTPYHWRVQIFNLIFLGSIFLMGYVWGLKISNRVGYTPFNGGSTCIAWKPKMYTSKKYFPF